MLLHAKQQHKEKKVIRANTLGIYEFYSTKRKHFLYCNYFPEVPFVQINNIIKKRTEGNKTGAWLGMSYSYKIIPCHIFIIQA